MTTIVPARAATPGAVGLVLAGAVSVQLGAAVAALLFPRAGVAGVVTLRLVIAAVVLVALCRPRLRGYSRADLAVVAGFGVALAGMNTLIYLAIERIPLGAAVTIEVLGPLVLSVLVVTTGGSPRGSAAQLHAGRTGEQPEYDPVRGLPAGTPSEELDPPIPPTNLRRQPLAGRRLVGLLWAVLALGGVVLLAGGGPVGLDPVGTAFAAGAAAMWAAYILLSAGTGGRFPGADGVALAMTVAALLTAPWGIAVAGPLLLDPVTVGLGAVIAVLSSVLPYTFELVALRRIPTSTFAVLMSIGPAIAAAAGLVVLGQALHPAQLAGIGLVVAASAGAVRSGRA